MVNNPNAEVGGLIVDASEELEFLPGVQTRPDISLIYADNPKQLPKRTCRRGMITSDVIASKN
jgi:hypothetical protein